MSAHGDQALAGPGGGGQDDVRPRDDLDERFLLVRVQRQPASLGPPGEGVEDGVGFGGLGQQVNERLVRPGSVLEYSALARSVVTKPQYITPSLEAQGKQRL